MSLGFPHTRRTPAAAPVAPPAPQLDAARALTARAFIALIDATLDAPHPLRGAEHLLRQITASGMGIVTADLGRMTLLLLNIPATYDDGTIAPSCTGLLRNWQTAAQDRLALGVRP